MSFVRLAQNMELVQALSGKHSRWSVCSSHPAGTTGSPPQRASFWLPKSPLCTGSCSHNRNTHGEVPCIGKKTCTENQRPSASRSSTDTGPATTAQADEKPEKGRICLCLGQKTLFIEEIFREQQMLVTKTYKRYLMWERSPSVRCPILSFTGEQITLHGCLTFAKWGITG